MLPAQWGGTGGHLVYPAVMRRALTLGLAILTCTAALWAHHSYGTFYATDHRTTLKGQVAKVAFSNPHVMLTIETKTRAPGRQNGRTQTVSRARESGRILSKLAMSWKSREAPPAILIRA